jgi:Icc-related predicted phosphoesterase
VDEGKEAEALGVMLKSIGKTVINTAFETLDAQIAAHGHEPIKDEDKFVEFHLPPPPSRRH